MVDDFEPFRRFVRSTLRKKPSWVIVGEVADGLEAVRRAKELKPDLILLDIGLPTLNGIEAARRIHKLSPESKILFVSQESDAEVVQEAFRVGGSGYVVKASVGIDLIAAVEVVIDGGNFVSRSLRYPRTPNQISGGE